MNKVVELRDILFHHIYTSCISRKKKKQCRHWIQTLDKSNTNHIAATIAKPTERDTGKD